MRRYQPKFGRATLKHFRNIFSARQKSRPKAVGQEQLVEVAGFVEPYISELRFQNGARLTLTENSMVVFVGPNGSGKTGALRQVSTLQEAPQRPGPISSLRVHGGGSAKAIKNWIDANCGVTDARYNNEVSRGGVAVSFIGYSDTTIQSVSELFCTFLSTEERLSYIQPPKIIAAATKGATHAIQLLYQTPELEDRISSAFRRAFGRDLIVHRHAGDIIPLYCGNRSRLPAVDQHRREFTAELEKLTKLEHEGDGLKSYATALLQLLALRQIVCCIDEPEAFLHPPQAEQLGEMVASNSGSGQFFIATHSANFLRGLLSRREEDIHVVRLVRDDTSTAAHVLPSDKLRAIIRDPFLRYSNVLEGIFNQRVVLCEAESDCTFYRAQYLALGGSHETLFVPCGGKSKIPDALKFLSALSVDTECVVDFDLLRDRGVLRKLCDHKGIAWQSVYPSLDKLAGYIATEKSSFDKHRLELELRSALDLSVGSAVATETLERISAATRKADPWTMLKRSGIAAVPSGEIYVATEALISLLAQHGIYVVPVGELEGFCRSIGLHGPEWVERVLELDLLHAPELEEARRFVRRLS
ncbi:ATP-dependent nuclease [Roseiterribacter gracilis]|uniref:ATPase AAA-type core domain-containing protein n=1 Tax=Roseiterribacter gracilis TaxID=2812848 RepID=A0A8S8XEV6_9PROT|nr:hypothetical protein TMPK1_26960 [Rhodospirillales bacterium TMPK1]